MKTKMIQQKNLTSGLMNNKYTWLTPKAEARLIGKSGWGSFALENIKKGEIVGIFGGLLMNKQMLIQLDLDRQHRSIQIDDDQYLVTGEERESGDCFNHSCDPTCSLMGCNILISRKKIMTGEQLTYDYATSDTSDYDQFKCCCGYSKCRGMITGEDWKNPDIQHKYKNEFSPYISIKIYEQK